MSLSTHQSQELQYKTLVLYPNLFITAAGTCVMSLLGTILLGMLKNKREAARARDNANNEVVRLTDIKDFNVTFWLITVICIAYYVAIFPLIALGK